MAAASRAIGRNHAYLQQYIRRGSPRHLDQKAATTLADLLNVKPESLAEPAWLNQSQQVSSPAISTNAEVADLQPSVAASAMPRDVPVLGSTVGGSDGDFLLNGQVVDHVRRPPAIEAMRSAFALFVQGDSMWPWRAPGSLVYVHPARPPRNGDHVVVELHGTEEDGERPCLVKRLVKRTPTLLRLEQYNPPRDDITIALDRVRSLYRVMEWEELLGL